MKIGRVHVILLAENERKKSGATDITFCVSASETLALLKMVNGERYDGVFFLVPQTVQVCHQIFQ